VTRAPRLLAVVAIAAGLALASTILHARETAYPAPPPTARLLYLRSGKAAARAMLSFRAVGADIYWIRAIQSFGRDSQNLSLPDRFGLLQPLLDVTTSLDPHFNIAYRFGAIYLSLERPQGPGRPDQAIALLEKGLANNPDRWQYAYDIAFINYWYTGDFQAAAEWFGKAAAMPKAPTWIQPIQALTLVRGGDRTTARTLLNELNKSEEAYVRQAADRGLMQLQTLDEIDQLQAVVDQFYAQFHAYPQSGGEFMRASRLTQAPRDPMGFPFVYDSGAHRVLINPKSSLNPLPRIGAAK
jgi:tetratricopeptide (TPR) repeat protein